MPRPRSPRNPDTLPDFGAMSLGDNPRQTMRVLGMVKAGHSLGHILEVGQYHGSWTPADVDRILRANKVPMPEPPDPRPNSIKLTSARTVPMSARQVQIAHLICQAMTNEEIAAHTGLPSNTVKSHVSAILGLCDCRDRVALVVAVLSRELVPVERHTT